MITFVKIAGFFAVLLGIGWCLEGINLLPGSFMTGQIRWAECAGLAIGVGISLLIAGKAGRSGRLREFVAVDSVAHSSRNKIYKFSPQQKARVIGKGRSI